MRVKFTFSYGAKPSAAELDAVQRLVDKPVERHPPDHPHYPGEVLGHITYEAAIEDVCAVFAPKPPPITIEGVGDPRPLLELEEMIRRLLIMVAANERAPKGPDTYVNKKVDVHVPGSALLAIEEVAIHEDLCTDTLQTFLDDGYRILAILPQPDQRRPDYVLGRSGQRPALPPAAPVPDPDLIDF